MALTPEQKPTLRTHILANTTVLAFGGGDQQIGTVFAGESLDAGDAKVIADWYNLPTSPALYSWHFRRTRMEVRTSILTAAGAANQLDALTGGKRDALFWLLDDTLEPRLPAVRASVDDLTGSQNTLKAAILAGFKRHVRNVERVFCTGTGSLALPFDNATAGGFEGTVTQNDVSDLHGLVV
jgi:hypothetical protein